MRRGPYGWVAAQATALINEGEWRSAASRANPQDVIERQGINGGEVVMLAEAFGEAEVVAASSFASTVKRPSPVSNVVPHNGDVHNGHEVVLTKAFHHSEETWFEMMDSNEGSERRLYLSEKNSTLSCERMA